MSRTWYLVRHGATVGESEIRFHGSGDVRLSEEGRGQIRRLAPRLAGLRPAALIHSPLSRARESMAILVETLGWTGALREEADLRELHFGACEGLSEPEIRERFPEFHARWKAGGGIEAFPEGEALEAFSARVAGAVDRIRAAVPAGDLVLVAHKGVHRRILFRLLGRRDPRVGPYDPPLGSVTVLREEHDRVELLDAGGPGP